MTLCLGGKRPSAGSCRCKLSPKNYAGRIPGPCLRFWDAVRFGRPKQAPTELRAAVRRNKRKRCVIDNRKTNAKKNCCALCGETKAVPVYESEIHKFRNRQGDAVITSYNVFPGIELAFYSVHMNCFDAGMGKTEIL